MKNPIRIVAKSSEEWNKEMEREVKDHFESSIVTIRDENREDGIEESDSLDFDEDDLKALVKGINRRHR